MDQGVVEETLPSITIKHTIIATTTTKHHMGVQHEYEIWTFTCATLAKKKNNYYVYENILELHWIIMLIIYSFLEESSLFVFPKFYR